MAVLPVTRIFSSLIFSSIRFFLDEGVGAKWYAAIRSVRDRLISSGQGLYKLYVLKPASHGRRYFPVKAASPAARVEVVSRTKPGQVKYRPVHLHPRWSSVVVSYRSRIHDIEVGLGQCQILRT